MKAKEGRPPGSLQRLVRRVGYVDRQEWSRRMGFFPHDKQIPKPVAVSGGGFSEGAGQILESFDHGLPSGCKRNGRLRLCVTVLGSEARLQQPVAKFIEMLRVFFKLIVAGYHVMRAPNDKSSATPRKDGLK